MCIYLCNSDGTYYVCCLKFHLTKWRGEHLSEIEFPTGDHKIIMCNHPSHANRRGNTLSDSDDEIHYLQNRRLEQKNPLVYSCSNANGGSVLHWAYQFTFDKQIYNIARDHHELISVRSNCASRWFLRLELKEQLSSPSYLRGSLELLKAWKRRLRSLRSEQILHLKDYSYNLQIASVNLWLHLFLFHASNGCCSIVY